MVSLSLPKRGMVADRLGCFCGMDWLMAEPNKRCRDKIVSPLFLSWWIQSALYSRMDVGCRVWSWHKYTSLKSWLTESLSVDSFPVSLRDDVGGALRHMTSTRLSRVCPTPVLLMAYFQVECNFASHSQRTSTTLTTEIQSEHEPETASRYAGVQVLLRGV